MALQASGLTLTDQTMLNHFQATLDWAWTFPDDDIGDPPNFWYAIQSQYSDDNANWHDYVGFPTTVNYFLDQIFQNGQADPNDPAPHRMYWRLKTLFVYRPPEYSNSVAVDVSNIVDPAKVPASNLRAACS